MVSDLRFAVVDPIVAADQVCPRPLSSATEAVALLNAARTRSPSFLEFRGFGHTLLLGVSAACGCAQYSPLSGEAPYLMAVCNTGVPEYANTSVEYSMNGCPTEIPPPFNIPIELVAEIAKHFVQFGEKWPQVEWKDV